MVARPRLRAGAAVLLCLLLPLLAAGQWDSEGRPVVVGLSDMKAMKGLKLLGKDLAALADAQTDAGAPRIGQAWCNATSYGHGRSRITFCNLAAYPPAAADPPCAALSLGVGRDFAAEAELAARHGCAAWVVDPLVRRRPEPAAGRLNFLRLPFVTGARGFHDGRALVKVPALADSLGVGRLAALRLDCRGCELALGRDVEGHGGGDFLSRVDQLSVRVHMGRLWAPGKQQALDFGRLAFLLRREGLQVVAALYGPCEGAQGEGGGGGCDELWAATGLRCEDQRPCADLLFAHEPPAPVAGAPALPDAGPTLGRAPAKPSPASGADGPAGDGQLRARGDAPAP